MHSPCENALHHIAPLSGKTTPCPACSRVRSMHYSMQRPHAVNRKMTATCLPPFPACAPCKHVRRTHERRRPWSWRTLCQCPAAAKLRCTRPLVAAAAAHRSCARRYGRACSGSSATPNYPTTSTAPAALLRCVLELQMHDSSAVVPSQHHNTATCSRPSNIPCYHVSGSTVATMQADIFTPV